MNLRERVVDILKWIPRQSIRHPKLVLLVAVIFSLAAAPGIWRLKLHAGGEALIPIRAPEVLLDRAVRDQFGIGDNIVVLVTSGSTNGIFNPATLQLVRDLSVRFAALPGVGAANVLSLATEKSFRFRPHTLELKTLLEPPLATGAELGQLREDLGRIGLYHGTLVSANEQTTAILISVPPGVDCLPIYESVEKVIANTAAGPDEIAVSGAPVAESLLGNHLLEDLGVPRALLGTSTRVHAGLVAGKTPGSFHGLLLLLAQRIGLVPLAVAVMLLVLLASFGNLPAALVPLPGIGVTLLLVFGLMGWCGTPVYLTMVVMPVLLTSLGVANDIYLFSRYFTLLRETPGAGHVALVGETFERLAAPLAATSLAAAAGFFSFGLSPLWPVRAFGLWAGAGALFGLWCSLTVVPALLTLANPTWFVPRFRRSPTLQLARIFARIGPAVVNHRRSVAGIILVGMAVLPLGLRNLQVQDSWTGAFDPQSDFSRATHLVNDQFFGQHLLLVSCDASRQFTGVIPGDAWQPGRLLMPAAFVPDDVFLPGSGVMIANTALSNAVWETRIDKAVHKGTNLIVYTVAPTPHIVPAGGPLRVTIAAQSQLDPKIIFALDDFDAFLRGRTDCGVGGVLGPADYLRTTRFLLRPDDVNAKILPAGAEEAAVLWNYYGFARGAHRLREAVDPGYTRSLTTVFLKDANFVDTARLMGAVRQYEQTNLAPKGIHLSFAGDVAVSQSLIGSIVTTQLQSLVWSLLGIFVVTSFLVGSWRWGLGCLLPSLLAVLVKFAVMGWSGIPLGVATSMFAAMTLGIGVNCAIHLLEGFAQARLAGLAPEAAVSRSLRLTGPPAFINTMAMSLGFGVLMLSQVPANARLGILLVLGLANCFVLSVLLLPVLLATARPAKWFSGLRR